MAAVVVGEHRLLAVAALGGARAAGAEAAADGRIEGRRQIALQDDAACERSAFGSGTGIAEIRACE
jgi:hypothetical protein